MEHSVLSVFHTYLMTPGKMLCLNGKAFDEFKLPLAQLKHKGMLIEERYKGAYSLTDIGYAAMRRKNMSRA